MFLRKFEDDLSEFLKDKVELTINGVKVTNNEQTILETILRKYSRFIPEWKLEKLNFIVYIDQNTQILAYGSITEFPHCCGKAIFHTIKIYHERHIKEENNSYKVCEEYTDDQYDQITLHILKLVNEICKNAKYSSIDFIISEEEQPYLYKSMTRLDHKPVYSFLNIRSNKHHCHNYAIDIKYD